MVCAQGEEAAGGVSHNQEAGRQGRPLALTIRSAAAAPL